MRFRQHQDDARQATRRLLWLFILTVTLTVLAVNAALALAWGFATGNLFGYPRWFIETNTGVALGFILGGGWLETLRLRQGGAHVATMVGGREILGPANLGEKRLRNVVDEMAIASGLKPPRIFVLDREDAINAFAAGWEQHDSVVAVTRGALERLTRDELQGVVAHEFSHILHGDTRLNMRLIGYVYGLQLIFNYGRSMFDMTDAHHRRSFSMVPGLALMTAGSAGWLAGRLLKAAVSRQREFLADASAIQYTRQPTGIGNALRKIAGQVEAGAGAVRNANAEIVSHLMLSSTIFERGGWLATHPPLADRLARIFGRPTTVLPAEVLVDEPTAHHGLPDAEMAYLSTTTGTGHAAGGARKPLAPAPPAQAETDTVASAPAERLDGLLGLAMPADLIAATLAFLVRGDAEPERAAWLAAVEPTGARTAWLERVWALPRPARQPSLERLLTRCEALDATTKLAMRRRAHRIVSADQQVSARELLHCLLFDHLLGLSPVVLTREVQRRSVREVAPAIQTFTAVLAALLAPPQQRAWSLAVCGALELDGTLPSPTVNLTSMTGALQELAELSAMARPALMKIWVQPVVLDAALMQPDFADALRTLCVLIDTPLPPVLVAWYGEGV